MYIFHFIFKYILFVYPHFFLNIWVVFHCLSLQCIIHQLKNKLFLFWQLWTKPLETFANRFSVNINFNFLKWFLINVFLTLQETAIFFFWKYLFSLPFPPQCMNIPLSYIFSITWYFFQGHFIKYVVVF